MTVLILADFTVNDKHTDLAKKTLDRVTELGVSHTCFKNTDKEKLKEATIVIQFLPKNKLIRLPGKTNVVVGTHKELGEFVNIVDEVWDDYPILLEFNDNTINIPHLAGEYIFYTINDNYDKSTTKFIIQAFAEEFDPAEPVNLLIKTNRVIDKEMVDIKTAVGKFKNLNTYKKHVVISKQYTDNELCAIHNSFDCYIGSEDDRKNFEYIKNTNNQYISESDSILEIRSLMRNVYKDRYIDDAPIPIRNLVDYFLEKLGELNG
jgi:hypothetical protein